METLNRVRLKCVGLDAIGQGFICFMLRIRLVVWYFAMSIDVLFCGCRISFSCVPVVSSCRVLLFCDIFMYCISLCKTVCSCFVKK